MILTLTNVRASFWVIRFVFNNLVKVLYRISETVIVQELSIAFTCDPLIICHQPFLKATVRYILSQKDIKSSIYRLRSLVTKENNSTKPFEDHTYFGSREPPICATCMDEWHSQKDKSVLSPLPTYGSSNPCLPPLLKASRSVALFLQKGETFDLVGYGT